MRGARYQRSPKDERTWNGRVYDSKREMYRAIDLHALAAQGVISNLREQVPFVLVPKDGKERAITYRADFVYVEGESEIVNDSKGHRTQLYLLKRRLMKHLHGITILET